MPPCEPNALPLNDLDFRRLRPLVGQAYTLLAPKAERRAEMFVESISRFALHKRFSGVCRLHKMQRDCRKA